MNNITGTFRINWFIGTLTLFSVGVLSGCEYCAPALLATFTGVMAYRFAKSVHEAMQIKPCNK